MDTITFAPIPVLQEWADLSGPKLREILCEEEEAAYRALPTPKRRRDWLAGRVAAKRLIGAELSKIGGHYLDSQIKVFNRPSGQPDWSVEVSQALPLPRWPISISHSSSIAACALNTQEGAVGMDIESVEERNPAWLEIAFHPSELSPEVRKDPALQTRLWTTKEAVLKLLGLGLRVDLWDVRCAAGAGGQVEAKLYGLSQHQYRQMGSPQIYLSTWHLSDSIVTVAYTLERVPGGLHGSPA